MTVTIKKKTPEKKLTKREQNERDLFWISSIRQLIPPVGDEDIWKKISPAACKVYLLIWALDSARWKWIPDEDKPYNGVHYAGIILKSGLKKKVVNNALEELIDLELIKSNMTWTLVEEGVFTDDNYASKVIEGGEPTYSLIYNLPADVIENGV